MKVRKQFVLREISGEYVILPMEKTPPDMNRLITLNEIQAYLWQMLQEEVSFDDLLRRTVEVYDVSEAAAREDIQEFLEILTEGGMLEEPK